MPSYLLAYAGVFFCFLSFVALAFFFQRFRWHIRKRLGKAHLGFYPKSVSLGNAFQTLQAMAQPQVEHMVEEKLDEEVDEDESGGPEGSTKDLDRQVAKLRKGQKVDRLNVRLIRPPR